MSNLFVPGRVSGSVHESSSCLICLFQDEYLDRFMSLVHAAEDYKIPARIGEANFESELKRSIGDLTHARSGPLIRFLPLILDKLLLLMVRPPIIAGQVGEFIYFN